MNTLWYARPAAQWIEALPIGNGRLGAMLFGQPLRDRLQLNDVTVWSGSPNLNADRPDAFKSLPELRRLIRAGKYAEAAKFADAHFNSPAPYSSSYQTLGDLHVDSILPSESISSYRRELDLSCAIAKTIFAAGDVEFTRETFSSAPGHAIIHRLSASKPGAITFTMSLTRIENARTHVEKNTLVMTGNTGKTLQFEVRAAVINQGGTITPSADGTLTVSGADDAMVVVTAATNFKLDYDSGYVGGDLAIAAQNMKAALATPYEKLKADHVVDYKNYFDRVTLDLGPAPAERPTDVRLKQYKADHDNSFAALFYQYGRYLLICSSRPDNPLPSNSQGIWGDGLDLPWKCDYKSNINYQMNYWPAESANLSELHRPMLRMTQNLTKPGSRTAEAYFGPHTPGWVVGYTTNGWSWTSPGESLPWGIWFGGSGWMCQHLWEHYAFTRDLDYLRAVFPTLKGAAEFYIATLIEDAAGHLISSPSTSPENAFTTDDGITSAITEGTQIDCAIIWDLLDNTMAACQALEIDPEFLDKAAKVRNRIKPPAIGKHGQLMEWNGDWDANAADIHHRHLSHLYGFFPGHQISVDTTPALSAAVKKSLEMRGDDGTGWSLAWKINCWARLRDAEHAWRLMDLQFRYTEVTTTVMADAGGTYPNLFDAHPPFQIDGNFGFVSGVNEMLLQSHERYVEAGSPSTDSYYIDLLPARPQAWSSGSVRGLRARGGFEVSMQWQDSRLVLAEIVNKSPARRSARVRYEGRTYSIDLPVNGTTQIKP